MQIESRFDFDKVLFTQDNELHLLISLVAPKMNLEEQRAKLAIVPAIDVSGSMSGDRLEYAKLSVSKLIDHLSPTDYCGLVVFSNDAELVSKPVLMTPENKVTLKQTVKKLHTLGSTAFAAGMLAALQSLNTLDVAQDVLCRVIMFTDGHANVGPRTAEQIVALLPENMGRCTISAFGYGDGVDQKLLDGLVVGGKGNYAFIKNPDDAPPAFAKELGGLLSVYSHNIKLTLKAKNGLIIDQIVSDVQSRQVDGSWEISIPELLSEEVRNLVIRCKLAKRDAAGTSDVIDLASTFITINPVQELTRQSSISIEAVAEGEQQTKPTAKVDDIVTLAQMVRAQIDAAKFADEGRYDYAEGCLEKFAGIAASKQQVGFAAMARKTRARFANAQSYNSNLSYLNSFKSGGTRGYGAAAMSLEAAHDLTLLSEDSIKLTNDAQDSMLESFKKNDDHQ